MHPCDICGKASHVWFNCPLRDTKPKDWKPERLLTRSTERKNHALTSAISPAESLGFEDRASDAKQAVDTIPKPNLGRPRIHPDRKAYRAAWMKDWRARKKASAEGRE
jgi:hypothetical protein